MSGIISRYGVEDSYGDIFVAGAFELLPDWIPMLWMHKRGEVVGRWDSVFTQGDDVRASGDMWTEAGFRQRTVRERVISGLSVGAYVDEFTIARRDDGWMGWDITKARLVEASIVDSPANLAAELDKIEAAAGMDEAGRGLLHLAEIVGASVDAGTLAALSRN